MQFTFLHSYQILGGGGNKSGGYPGVPLPSVLNPELGTCYYGHNFVNTGELLLFWPAHLACTEGSALQCCSLSCVSVCVCPFSLLCLLTLLGVQREVSAATAWKMQ